MSVAAQPPFVSYSTPGGQLGKHVPPVAMVGTHSKLVKLQYVSGPQAPAVEHVETPVKRPQLPSVVLHVPVPEVQSPSSMHGSPNEEEEL